MQQEDDLRGPAKVMDFMRVLDILLVIIPMAVNATCYAVTLSAGYICLLMGELGCLVY